ncbi:hypothetical protein [Chitinophaga nivalis]|uniref:Uncharacterized protein n=1 Tax=Chitinophaga nivalis TaxID=2991709 RepID=A0ABT3IFI4_9BACT|nr:hypothetical protein [Chitinophaga nivalis]MCW3467586.1 hypothetical protein [Chitinophaga nivalis]MCW3482722.1 hypothetical protein [Chitinophaga nivalis]
MKSIFNAKTAIVACLAVTVITLSSFTHSKNSALLGKGKVVDNNLPAVIASGSDQTTFITPYPTTLIIRPTLYIIRITALRTAILDYPTADIITQPGGPIARPGILNEQQLLDSKMRSLD